MAIVVEQWLTTFFEWRHIFWQSIFGDTHVTDMCLFLQNEIIGLFGYTLT
jgi:hypothetical protein